MEKKNYSEKLKDPRWQKKRLEIFQRDRWCCQSCNASDKTLHIHHLDYISGNEPWDYPNEYLITLCENCHENISLLLPELLRKLNSNIKLKFKNGVDLTCLAEVFSDYKDIQGIIYILWELKDKQEIVVEFLRDLFTKEC